MRTTHTHTRSTLFQKARRPLVALSMLVMLGMGMEAAHAGCASCPKVSRPVRSGTVSYGTSRPAVRSATVVRSAPVVVSSRPAVVYSSTPSYRPMYYPVVVEDRCNTCTPVLVCDPCATTARYEVYPAVTGTCVTCP